MEPSLPSVGVVALLGLGMLFGVKHATEVDHIVAVSTIVSQHRSVMRSAWVGAMWGAGHTLALLITGIVVLSLRVAIPESVSNWLEFSVALMIIALGASALWRVLRKGSEIHLHKHEHDGLSHVHVHFHDKATKHVERSTAKHSHAVGSVGLKPLLIGTMHGLAGSGALTLLVLTQIKSAWVGLAYLGVFGLGSVVGMLVMSGLIGLPFALTSRNLTNFHHRLQAVAAVLSICFGIWYAYETGAAAFL
jgi:ABC-type nickel/cobalt efflux system permease component RcnA